MILSNFKINDKFKVIILRAFEYSRKKRKFQQKKEYKTKVYQFTKKFLRIERNFPK